jgi:hypothetical protein
MALASRSPYKPYTIYAQRKVKILKFNFKYPKSKKDLGHFFEFRRKNGLQNSFFDFKKIKKF